MTHELESVPFAKMPAVGSSADPTNSEKFTTYQKDGITGIDYATNVEKFMTSMPVIFIPAAIRPCIACRHISM